MNFYTILIQVLTLTGALVLFLYGMKVMSESLQKIAGRNLRDILAKITSRPARGILVGFVITAIIQSSSATTVLLVSFVNAGLVSFAESISIIFGANIGTTITAWIISIVGLGNHFSIYSIILPLVALSLPFFFSVNNKYKAHAEFIIGFAMLFIGILFFKENLPEIDKNSAIFQSSILHNGGFLSTIMFVGLGILITIIFQSSSATITLTMLLAAEGWFSFDSALAMVLGDNIGTTATANLAAIIANRSAKRTALAHALFNVIGILWVLPFLQLFSKGIEAFLEQMNVSLASQIPFGISIFHTLFNLLNALLLTIFIVPFRKLCLILIPNGIGSHEEFSLKYIDSSLLSTSELSILQVRKEIALMGRQVGNLYEMVPEILLEKKDSRFAKRFKKLQKGEDIVDDMGIEIAGYIKRLKDVQLSEHSKNRINAMLLIVEYLENIADLCLDMGHAIHKKKEANAWFTQELRNNLAKEFNLIEKSLNLTVNNLAKDYFEADIEEAERIEYEIVTTRSELKKIYLNEIDQEKLPDKAEVFYNELLNSSEKIGDLTYNINRAMFMSGGHNHTRLSDKKNKKK